MKYKAKSIHQTNYVGHNKGRSAALVFDPSRAPSVTNRNMASADSQPRFGQSVKGLLSDKVGSCGGDVIALTRQVLKGSRSQEVNRYEWFNHDKCVDRFSLAPLG